MTGMNVVCNYNPHPFSYLLARERPQVFPRCCMWTECSMKGRKQRAADSHILERHNH